MVRVGLIIIENRNSLNFDLGHLVRTRSVSAKGSREFSAKGFGEKPKSKVYASILRAASTLDSDLAVIETEHKTKRGHYRVEVSFYKGLNKGYSPL
jgi:hypothetical protein